MILAYTLATLWHERSRFLSGMLAVAFSAALIALQTGLLLGLFATTSAPIDHAAADIWVGAPRVLSVDLGRPIAEDHIARLASHPAVEAPETLLLDYGYWIKGDGSKELCIVIGSHLAPGALGAVEPLTPGVRARLSEPGAVAIDRSEMTRLGVRGIDDYAQVNGKRVRVVGITRGLKSLTGPYIFCSVETARPLLHALPDQTTYLLARCTDPAAAAEIVKRIRSRYPDLSAFTKEEFSLRTRLHWLIMTNAGLSTGFTAILGLVIGAVITSQTLYAATIASLREFAVLRALGIPRYKIAGAVLSQSLGVGLIGVLAAVPVIFGLARGAVSMGTEMYLPWWLLAGTGVLTVLTALLSGLAALRSLRELEPAMLLR
jgi:putative ABC transport system permease protein